MFDKFDFKVLDDKLFKEDSVREELIVPVLERLGYSATGEHKIVRSEPLVHPFVHIGTKAYKVNIISDYQLAPAGKKAWVLDAKAPGEDIRKGKNVEQAYSYAIHPDVRVPFYGLCNGRELVVFHISEVEPRLAIDLRQIDARWIEVSDLLSPLSFTNPQALQYLPDFGLTLKKLGYTDFEIMYFLALEIGHVSKANDELFSLTSCFELGAPYCASFDADPAHFEQFLQAIEPRQRERIEKALYQMPYHIYFEDDLPRVTIGAVMGTYVVERKVDSFLPLKVVEIRK
jgi:hypothetical protein